jgi:DNA-directed RNA polymerase alpha subunit
MAKNNSNTQPESDLPARLAKPAQRALAAAGYTRLEQFTKVTEAELLNLHGMGPNALKVIRESLAARGLSFAESNFPTGIGNPATQALTVAGYTDLEQFTSVSEAELLKLHGVGPKAVGIIRESLAARGLSFAND